MSSRVFIRADASVRIGTGHLMRCLTLADALQRAGFAPSFLVRPDVPALLDRVRGAGFEVIEVAANADPATSLEPTVARVLSDGADNGGCAAVVDGYQFDCSYRLAVRATGATTLVIDDLRPQDIAADVFLDQNFGATASLYQNPLGATLLLGVEFALLREEFRTSAERPARDVVPRARRLLVSMGGSDPDGVTGRVLDAVALLGDAAFEIDVLCGAANPRLAELRARAGRPGSRIRILLDPPGIAELMAQADLAVAAGGTTSWEMLCVGLPSLKVILADNQVAVVRALAEAGLAADVGEAARLEPERLAREIDALAGDRDRRRFMAREGRRVVDGRGAERVASALRARFAERRAEAR